jgi:hypothetical protein
MACPATPDPSRPETLLQLGCSPGYDDSGLLLGVGILVCVPLAAALIAAARALLRDEGVALFGVLALGVCGAAILGALDPGSADGTRRVAITVAVLAGLTSAALLADVIVADRWREGPA